MPPLHHVLPSDEEACQDLLQGRSPAKAAVLVKHNVVHLALHALRNAQALLLLLLLAQQLRHDALQDLHMMIGSDYQSPKSPSHEQ